MMKTYMASLWSPYSVSRVGYLVKRRISNW